MVLHRRIQQIAFSAALVGVAMLSASRPARADRDYTSDCREKLNADKYKIDNDAKRHGENSRQVQHDVDKMDADRKWCRDHKAEWDHGLFDTGIYIKK